MKKLLHFTQEQVTKILQSITEEKDGFNKVLKIALDALIRAECSEATGDGEAKFGQK